MASTVVDNVKQLGESVADSVTQSVAAMTDNAKIADLKRNIKDSHSSQINTTDYGAKISDLDHWQKPVDQNGNKIGPHLLQDQIAREKVGDDSRWD
jgi:catalase